MGQEIESANFGRSNAGEFARRLARETDDVVRWGAEGRFVRARPQIGVEVEACLVDERFHALPINEKFLSRLADPHATIELARFNVEFNPPPIPLAGDAFDRLRAVLGDIMTRAFDVAESFDARILLAGILPTLTPGDLESRLISKSRRYRAFAAKFASWQKSRMARVEIPDNEGLVVGVNSVIMESVTTSQQIHLQIPEPGSGAYYNAAQLVAAPMVAVGANSPFFMGRDLWAESRVPVFEQVLGPRFAAGGGDDFFGRGYVEESALEIFVHNRERLPVILPELREEKTAALIFLCTTARFGGGIDRSFRSPTTAARFCASSIARCLPGPPSPTFAPTRRFSPGRCGVWSMASWRGLAARMWSGGCRSPARGKTFTLAPATAWTPKWHGSTARRRPRARSFAKRSRRWPRPRCWDWESTRRA